MRKYELMTIAKITLGEDGARALSNSVKDLISSNKGKTLNSDFWGKRKLAYEIKHDQEAFYEIIEFEMEPTSVALFKTKLNLEESLVRYIIGATE